MNILVTLDSNYVTQLITLMNSVSYSNPKQIFDYYIIHSTLTPYDLKRIERATVNSRIHPIVIDDDLFDGAHFTKRITKETYYRLLLCDYLPKELDKILYLDPDIVVINPLDEIYNTDFGDKCFVGAGHTYGIVEKINIKRLKMEKDSTYINAGFIMINLNNLRKIISADMIFSYVNKMGKKLFQADQDVLNALFSDKTIYVKPEIYNLDDKTMRKKKVDMRFVRKNTVIVHYDGKNKPWKPEYKGNLNIFYNFFSSIEHNPGRRVMSA